MSELVSREHRWCPSWSTCPWISAARFEKHQVMKILPACTGTETDKLNGRARASFLLPRSVERNFRKTASGFSDSNPASRLLLSSCCAESLPEKFVTWRSRRFRSVCQKKAKSRKFCQALPLKKRPNGCRFARASSCLSRLTARFFQKSMSCYTTDWLWAWILAPSPLGTTSRDVDQERHLTAEK